MTIQHEQGEEQYNWTSHRQRGYGVGSLNQGPNEPDKYWKQPGHPLNKETKGGRFEVRHALVDGWDGSQRPASSSIRSTTTTTTTGIDGSIWPLTTGPHILQGLKGYESWDPSDPDGKKTGKPIRSLDEN
jgi:hypothetical protein